jgi:gas vesicle structural protein
MAVAQATPRGYLERPRPSGLADVIDVILDKGLVIDAYVRVSLIGIEILTIDARIVIASVDTYLRFAEAVGRMDIAQSDDAQGLPELMESMSEGGSQSKTKGALEGVKEALFGGDDDDEEDEEKEKTPSRQRSSSSGAGSRSSSGRSSSGSSRSRSSSGSSKSRSSSGSSKSRSSGSSKSGSSKSGSSRSGSSKSRSSSSRSRKGSK